MAGILNLLADRMDDLMWHGFHDIVHDVYCQRGYWVDEYEILDEDIIKVRKELKKYI